MNQQTHKLTIYYTVPYYTAPTYFDTNVSRSGSS